MSKDEIRKEADVHVLLSQEWRDWIDLQVRQGRYASRSACIRQGLWLLRNTNVLYSVKGDSEY